ncbi:hypothetical protein K3495_g16206, partial [Podosphaera aphanis]
LAHVFHNLDEIRPAVRPERPSDPTAMNQYYQNLAKWKEGEIEAKNVLLRRLSQSVRPHNFRNMTAKQIFDNIASTREENAATPYETAVRNLWGIKFTTIDDYCDKFMQYYLSVNSAAESMISQGAPDSENLYLIPQGYASCLFVLGTEKVDWLETWRQTKVQDSKGRYLPLEKLMSTLRQVGGPKLQSSGQVHVATGAGDKGAKEREKAVGGPEDACVLCKHRHRNKECYRQHPELKRFKKKSGKGKGKSRGSVAIEGSEESSSEDEGVSVSKLARCSSASLIKNPLLYDTGASHHFVRCEKDFVHLKKLRRPFHFDQAIGTS